ncbi:MAG: DNA-3-methyladenine glycosylase [Actinomycetota bacterium]|jgi:DNA-3-methyladenine glycosylase I|nr:DNA-3-methyladenine glycosylase [Actinomycetota bacterium]
MSYCELAPADPWHGPYHNDEYGFPTRDDAVLFERLVLEINQAGLSWLTVLKKRAAFRAAFGGFDPEVVAAYGPDDRERLLADAGIIRNRAKVDAAIANAQTVELLRAEHGSFAGWLDANHPRLDKEWARLFKSTFRFTGPEITKEFLMSTGYLPGAHEDWCPVGKRITVLRPPWMDAGQDAGQ